MGNRGQLTRRVLGGVVWTSLGQVLTLAIRLGSMAVLARLLSPEDYGVFGLGLLCIALPADITRSGFAMSLVQRDEIEHGHIRAAFSYRFSPVSHSFRSWRWRPSLSDDFSRAMRWQGSCPSWH